MSTIQQQKFMEHFGQEARCYLIEQKKYLDTGSNASTPQSKNMPAKKCSTRKSAPKRKPAAKRKSSTTRRASATTRRPSTASRSRSRSASACCARQSVSACTTGCRSPYMMNSGGRCGTVPCLDSKGNPLIGYVRNSSGECAPKNCGAGYVFNYATGKCVSQNSALGQQLLAVKKHNDAQLAVNMANENMALYKNPYDSASAEYLTYEALTGGADKIAEVQNNYRRKVLEAQKKRQKDYETQLASARKLELERSRLMATPYAASSCSTRENPWGAFF